MVRPCFLAYCSAVFFSLANPAAFAEAPSECEGWAISGECDKNPGYMLQNCAAACEKVQAAANADNAAIAGIGSFFDLSAPDIDGNEIKFEQFRGQVTVLVNVASYCGYTESHYQGLVELYGHVQGEAVNILAFPCNQFGQQEPDAADKIKAFAKKKGVEFQIMGKVNVNGPDASLVYKYLKQQTGVASITWNFATYFVVSPEGVITAHSGVEPMELKGSVLSLLSKEEL